jgi:glutamate dehydrogenase (NADP+)
MVVFMVLSMLPTNVFAAYADAECPHCGTAFSGTWTEVTAGEWNAGGDVFTDGTHYRLTGKQTLTAELVLAEGKTVCISGSGNVAQYAVKKATELGAKVVTMSDSNGFIYDPEGITPEKWEYIYDLKNVLRGRIKEYVDRYPNAQYFPDARPWSIPCDIAMPCATQNELNGEEAKMLIANGCMCVAEGANMPSTPEAIEVFQNARILYAPCKAANAGGVATSGLEMTQNSMRLKWSPAEVDAKLHEIMSNIHAMCVEYGTEPDGYINYVKGANIGGFIKVARAMLSQGLV